MLLVLKDGYINIFLSSTWCNWNCIQKLTGTLISSSIFHRNWMWRIKMFSSWKTDDYFILWHQMHTFLLLYVVNLVASSCAYLNRILMKFLRNVLKYHSNVTLLLATMHQYYFVWYMYSCLWAIVLHVCLYKNMDWFLRLEVLWNKLDHFLLLF